MRIIFVSAKKLLVEAMAHLLVDLDCNWDIWGTLDIEEGLRKPPQFKPGDVIILTEPAFDFSTESALEKINTIGKGVPIVVVSCNENVQSPASFFQHSVMAILTKDCKVEEFCTAIKMASVRKPYLTPAIALTLAAELYFRKPLTLVLSPRQKEIIVQIMNGTTTTQIAKNMSLSVKTVSTHIRRIKVRLGLGSTSEIIRYGIEHDFAIRVK